MEQRRNSISASIKLVGGQENPFEVSCLKCQAVPGDSCHVSDLIMVSGGGAATGNIVTSGTGSMPHTLGPMAHVRTYCLQRLVFYWYYGEAYYTQLSLLTPPRACWQRKGVGRVRMELGRRGEGLLTSSLYCTLHGRSPYTSATMHLTTLLYTLASAAFMLDSDQP